MIVETKKINFKFRRFVFGMISEKETDFGKTEFTKERSKFPRKPLLYSYPFFCFANSRYCPE